MLAQTPLLTGMPASASDLERVDIDMQTVLDFLESVVAAPGRLDEHADLLESLGPFWFLRRRLADGIRLLRHAAATCTTGACTPRTTAVVTLSLGSALAYSQSAEEAHELLTSYTFDDVERIVVAGDRDPERRTIRLASLALAAWVGDDHALAGDYVARAAASLSSASDGIVALVTATSALCELVAGEMAASLEHAHTALALSTERADPLAMHLAAVVMGIGSLFDGDPRMGLRWNDQAFRAYLDAGGVQICDTVEQRGNHLAAGGEITRAAHSFAVSRAYATDAGMDWPRLPFTHDAIRGCRDKDNAGFEAGWRTGSAAAREAMRTGDHERFVGM
ncbi:hypothetical protein [Gordonia sp. ABSL49_1]|uniref:hypothetical protein n=1 Tax=Gordonia sp. ABSL49_1 TaxID=2920941 RepID=UPI001F0CF224|nr:hypothetical protein [Gordonia sp. ABSL49_1]MCH5641573.1 hypothetical protein [Gordonia sp. ABSL49_1]